MTFIFIGLTVGLIMGLTGAGGALISIPMFIFLLNFSLKDATFVSLIAVLISSLLNMLMSLKKSDIKLATTIGFFGVVTNFLTKGIKSITPESIIVILLLIVGIYGIHNIWKKKKDIIFTSEPIKHITFKSILSGLILGILTTLTGLGGGVLLIPLLTKYFGHNYTTALPTSFVTIFIISLSSFSFQYNSNLHLIELNNILKMSLGIVLAYYILIFILKKIDQRYHITIRQIAFTLVSIYSMISVLISLN